MKKKAFFSRLWGKKNDLDDICDRNLDAETREMMKGLVDLSDTTVKEVMVPRTDVTFVPIDIQRKELLAIVADCEFSRIPVYDTTIDNIIGILHVKDLLRFFISGGDAVDLKQIIRKAYFVPESKKLNSMLKEFKRRKVHIAIVVDEYGGTSGVICLEDIIEEIVGDIQDEFDNETEDIIKIGEGIYLCDARINLEDLTATLGIHIADKDYDTLGGYVLDLFGKIPVRYEKVVHKNLDFIIQEMDGNKILTVKIIMRKEDENEKPLTGE